MLLINLSRNLDARSVRWEAFDVYLFTKRYQESDGYLS